MTKLLLAISGKRFSGKDTLAALLVQHARARGVTLETYAFAAESKRMFTAERALAGVSVDLERLQHDRDYKERWRPELTPFTMDALARDPLVFCRSVAERIEASAAASLVTDVRLRLEVTHLRSRFRLHLVRIARSDATRAASGWAFTPSADDHPTETQLDDPSLWDEVMTNDGSVEELSAKAEALIAAQLAPP